MTINTVTKEVLDVSGLTLSFYFWYQSQYNILLKTLFEEEEVNHRILDC